MIKNIGKYLVILGVVLMLFFSNYSSASQCSYVEINTSVEFNEQSQHCLSLPIYTNDPLIIIQGETRGDPYNQFNLEVLSSNNINSPPLESFMSSGRSAIRTSVAASQMGIATIVIKPVDSNKYSQIRVVYGEIDGVNTLFVYNTNTVPTQTPPVDDPTPPPIGGGPTPPPIGGDCGTWINGMFVCLEPLSVNKISVDKVQVSLSPDGNLFSASALSSPSTCNTDNSSPRMPQSFDLNKSLKAAEEYKASTAAKIASINEHGSVFEKRNIGVLETSLKYAWAFDLMNDGQPLDLKAHHGTGSEFEDFGNFHYGAFLTAAGFERSEILSGASTNQAWKDNGGSWGAVWPAIKGWFTQDQDHAQDNLQVERGIKYANEVYANDTNAEAQSDSCDPNNGLDKGNSTNPTNPTPPISGGGGGGGGSDGGISPDVSGAPGDSGSTLYTWGCELWELPDGNGGFYYMELNCNHMWM